MRKKNSSLLPIVISLNAEWLGILVLAHFLGVYI